MPVGHAVMATMRVTDFVGSVGAGSGFFAAAVGSDAVFWAVPAMRASTTSTISSGVAAGIWSEIGVGELAFLVVFAITLVAVMLWLTRMISTNLGFSRGDVIATQFCGSKKSLATGAPMASVIFGTGGTLGLIILPLMIYHQVQLMMCSALASRYATCSATGADAGH